MSSSVNTNYGGRQPNNTAYIKNFFYGAPAALWKTLWGTTITTASPSYQNVYIPKNLIVGGHIFRKTFAQTDDYETVNEHNNVSFDTLTAVTDGSTYGFTYDSASSTFPTLVQNYDMDYANLIPLLVYKVNQLEKQIAELTNN